MKFQFKKIYKRTTHSESNLFCQQVGFKDGFKSRIRVNVINV